MSSNAAPATGPTPTSASIHNARDAYMQLFSDMFADELVEIYETDSSVRAVQQLTSCIESGMAVWGYPMEVKNPMVE